MAEAETITAVNPALPDLTLIFLHTVERQICEKGVYPYPCLWRDKEGRLCSEFLECEFDDAYERVHQTIELRDAQEIIFGIDRYAQPGQGIKGSDFLSAHHWQKGQPWRYGVIEYSFGPPRVAEPIQWDHHYWTPKLLGEHKHWARVYRPMTIMTRKADGTVDLHGLEGIRQPKESSEGKEATSHA